MPPFSRNIKHITPPPSFPSQLFRRSEAGYMHITTKICCCLCHTPLLYSAKRGETLYRRRSHVYVVVYLNDMFAAIVLHITIHHYSPCRHAIIITHTIIPPRLKGSGVAFSRGTGSLQKGRCVCALLFQVRGQHGAFSSS